MVLRKTVAAGRDVGGKSRRQLITKDEAVAVAAAQNGIALAPEQIYDFSTPPVLGGELAVENLSATDFQVARNIAGQIHEQVRNLPPGTPISEIKISPPE